MTRPRINIKLEPIDKMIELIGLIGLITLIGLPIIYFNEFPDTMPIHFGANGEPDAWSGKGMIWTLPIIGVVLYLAMFGLNKFPHIFNYPQKITKDDAGKSYKIATRMIRTLNTLIACVFAYITYSTIQTALGNQNGLGILFTPIFLILIFGITGYFSYKLMKKGKLPTANQV